MNRESGGACPACGRRFAASVLQCAAGDTVGLPVIHGGEAPACTQLPGAAEAARAGEVLGHYRIVGTLGHGGMGTVYRALDESLQRYVALKVIRAAPAAAADTRHVQRLLQEAIAQARVNHPNVVHIYYVGREGKSPFFAMELVNGPTLAQRLEEGPLPFAEVIACAQQVVSALQHAADFDVLHGDVKPSNILLADAGTVKLSDFGLARRLSEIAEQPDRVAGTPNYLAPEAAAGAPLDVRSDMYSLGVTLFEVTFGRLPYAHSGSGVLERLRAHREAPVDFPHPWPDSVPGAWRAVLAKLLAKTPAERYPDYGTLMADLARSRPVALPAAGRALRGLAWLVDLGLANTVREVLSAPLTAASASNSFEPGPGLPLAVAFLGGLAPLLGSLLQSFWGTTPGKKLFQLRIVDRHGLALGKAALAARMAVQLLPIWAGTVLQVCGALGAPGLGQLLGALLLLAAVLDAGFAFFHRRCQSLHDLLFGTRVVLDTGPHPGP